jgi:hypothetical protein
MWPGCQYRADARLENRSLCRDHFYEAATTNLQRYQSRLEKANSVEKEKISLLNFVSEVIGQTTVLVARTKFLSEAQRDLFLALSHSAIAFYKRVQRDPRKDSEVPLLLSSTKQGTPRSEATRTVNISLKGACLETKISWQAGEEVRIARLDTNGEARARVTWVEHPRLLAGRIGIEILDSDDFWGLKPRQSVEMLREQVGHGA